MIIGITSDLHGYLPQIQPCTVLCICGDIVPLNIQRDINKSEKWFKKVFIPWVMATPCKYVYFIAGNHDFYLQYLCLKKSRLEVYETLEKPTDGKLTFLYDEVAHIPNGENFLNIYGTPWCHIFGDWAFMRGDDDLTYIYNKIPDFVDILLTHDAPAMNGVGMIHEGKYSGEEAGNEVLSYTILKKTPKYAFCGHIHSGEHELQTVGNTKIANTSIMNEAYKPVNKILYINI